MSLITKTPIKLLDASAVIEARFDLNKTSRYLQQELLDNRKEALKQNKDFKNLIQANNLIIKRPELVPLGGTIAIPVVYTHSELEHVLEKPMRDMGEVEYVGLMLVNRKIDGSLINRRIWDTHNFSMDVEGTPITLPPENMAADIHNKGGVLMYARLFNSFTWEKGKRDNDWLRVEELKDGVTDDKKFKVTVWERGKLAWLIERPAIRCVDENRVPYVYLGKTREEAVTKMYRKEVAQDKQAKAVELF